MQEDKRLISKIDENKNGNQLGPWRAVAAAYSTGGFNKSPASCRLRWALYHLPSVRLSLKFFFEDIWISASYPTQVFAIEPYWVRNDPCCCLQVGKSAESQAQAWEAHSRGDGDYQRGELWDAELTVLKDRLQQFHIALKPWSQSIHDCNCFQLPLSERHSAIIPSQVIPKFSDLILYFCNDPNGFCDMQLHQKHGDKWSAIAKELNEQTEEILKQEMKRKELPTDNLVGYAR